jgi:hypothetical protein
VTFGRRPSRVGSVTIGGVLGEAWNLYKRFLGRFFLTALVVFAVLDLLSALADQAVSNGAASQVFWALVATIIGFVGYFWVQAALVETVRDVRDGRADRSIGETYSTVRPRLPAAIIGGILAGIGIFIGLILLIIPGLYLLTIWSMLIPVIVIEGRSAGEAFGRSQDVVRGHGWSVFGLVIITFLLVAIAAGLIRALFSPLPDFLDAWLGGLVAHSVTVPFAAAALTTAYFTLVQPATSPDAPTVVTPQ